LFSATLDNPFLHFLGCEPFFGVENHLLMVCFAKESGGSPFKVLIFEINKRCPLC
jgi:hypothetical protein